MGPTTNDNTNTSTNSTANSSTKITVDYFVNENETLKGLDREHEQRALILDRWKANGMTVKDIGYLSDADETFSRDFIRAMQICDVPAFRHADTIQNCTKKAKVVSLSHITFEGSPMCVPKKKKQWYHPDMVRYNITLHV